MTINDAIRYLRLPANTTQEDLECNFGTVLNYGDKVVLAGYFYTGRNKPCFFGACYDFLTNDHSCEGEIILRAASNVEFFDNGHAIMWAIKEA